MFCSKHLELVIPENPKVFSPSMDAVSFQSFELFTIKFLEVPGLSIFENKS